jgi:hypothetical protein
MIPLIAMIALGVAVLVSTGAAYATTLHVSPGGADVPACGPQGAPCQHLDYAVHKAASGDTIRVAGGTQVYAGNQCFGVTVPTVVCLINKSLSIQGGFSPATWAFDPASNPTVIDGQNTFRGVWVVNSLGGGNPSMRLTMSHVTIQNALAPGTAADQQSAFGGGMEVVQAAVTLESVTFLNNRAVGGDTGGAGGAGAGSALSIRSSPAGSASFLSNVHFQGNASTGGQGASRGGVAFGAVFVFTSTVTVDNSRFIGNTAQGGSSPGSGDVGGVRADALGGAMGIESGAVVTLTRVTATGNQVTGGPGAQFGGGGFGGALFVENAHLTIADSLVQSNVARGANTVHGGFGGGGGVMFFNSSGRVDRTRILANNATSGNSSPGQLAGSVGGGGLYLWRNNPAVALPVLPVVNTVLADNSVALGQGNNPGGGGAGVFVQGLTADLTHVTLARNQLGPGLVVGQAVAVIEAPGVSTTTANLNYSVVADHVAATAGATALVVSQTNTLNLSNGAFAGNTHNVNDNSIPLPPGSITGLGSMLTVGTASFASPGPPHHDYHLNAGSPLRDAANGTTMALDMDNQPRVDGRPDIGADEFVRVTLGDYNQDGKADLLFRHSNGTLAMWLMNGTGVLTTGVFGTIAPQWSVAGVGDFNGDGRDDILWRDSFGTLAIWLMNGTTISGTGLVGNVGTDWTIFGVADFNGDGRADILWRHSSGTVAIWFMNGFGVALTSVLGSVGTDWTIAGVGDFNADGMADILWRHTSALVSIWLLAGPSVIGTGTPGNAGAGWAIAGVGDVNNDGRADIIRRHTSGVVEIWLMNGTSISGSGVPGSAPTDWGIVGVADFDNNGRADILWQHASGSVYAWLMSGTTIVGAGTPGSAGGGWQFK